MELIDRPVQNTEVAMQILDGNAYLMDAAASELHALSPVGTRIYELLDGSRTVADIAAALSDEYEVDQATAERDALAFLTELQEKGLVRID